jgi:acyl-CoA thioesterase-1
MKRSLFVFLLTLFLFPAAFAKKLLVLGDSLTEGFGVAKEMAYPALLEKKLRAGGQDWTVINAGISGSTSASAVSRLKWQLKNKPDVLLLALGANDGLRGLKTDELEKNLAATIELAQKENIPVILVGMMMPPNYSKDYTEKFKAVYPRLAKKYRVKKFIPFLLEGVGGVTSLNQSDGIHPNEKGQEAIADHLYEQLKDVL